MQGVTLVKEVVLAGEMGVCECAGRAQCLVVKSTHP